MSKEQSKSKIRRKLAHSLDGQIPVRLTRSVAPDDREEGIVRKLGEDWVLLVKLRDRAYFNGYMILRIADLERVKLKRKFMPFIESRTPAAPQLNLDDIDLGSAGSIYGTTSAAAPLILLYEEERAPDKLWIGTVVELRRKSAWIHMINPNTRWYDKVVNVRFKNLTRIDLLSDYDRALLYMAGPEPKAG